MLSTPSRLRPPVSDRAVHYARQRRDFALLMGWSWMAYGLMTIVSYPKEMRALSWLPEGAIDGADAVGCYIILFGLIATLSAWLITTYPALERFAYATLTGAPLTLAIGVFIGAATDAIPQGWVAGTGYLMFSAIAYYMSGLRPSDAQIRKAKENLIHE